MTLTARVKVVTTDATDATAGLVFRSDIPASGASDKNEYYLGIYPNQNLWKLWKVTNGSFVLVESGTQTFTLNRYYTLQLQKQGDDFKILIDGVEHTYNDPDPYSFTNVGFRTRDAVAYFDDVRAESYEYGASTTFRLNESSGELMHQIDSQGNVTVTYIQDEDGNIVAEKRGENLFFYHFNTHGDVVAITDVNGIEVATFSYDAWGAPTERDQNGTIVPLGNWAGSPGDGLYFLFAGMLYDAAAGLYLTKTRAYNPRTGRFLQRDKLDEDPKDGYDGFTTGKDALASNLYIWTDNNPVSNVDPAGTNPFGDAWRWAKGKASEYYAAAAARVRAAWARLQARLAQIRAAIARAKARAIAIARAAAARARAAAAAAAARARAAAARARAAAQAAAARARAAASAAAARARNGSPSRNVSFVGGYTAAIPAAPAIALPAVNPVLMAGLATGFVAGSAVVSGLWPLPSYNPNDCRSGAPWGGINYFKLPDDPSDLPPGWVPDPSHKDPNGTRYRGDDGEGRALDWSPGRDGLPGWRGKDHWHDQENFGKNHLPPGTEVPD